MEIAEEIGVSQAQISRIEKVALERMKRKMLKKLDAFEIVCFTVIMIYIISIIYVLTLAFQ